MAYNLRCSARAVPSAHITCRDTASGGSRSMPAINFNPGIGHRQQVERRGKPVQLCQPPDPARHMAPSLDREPAHGSERNIPVAGEIGYARLGADEKVIRNELCIERREGRFETVR